MAKTRFLLGAFVMALLFGMTVVGCDNGSTSGSSADSALNGTWDAGENVALICNNGSVKFSWGGLVLRQGKYSAKDGQIKMTITAVNGLIEGLADKMYSKSELRNALELSDADFEAEYGDVFTESVSAYRVDGNTLTVTDADGKVNVYTKR